MQITKYITRTGCLTAAILALGLVGCAHNPERTASGYWSDKMTSRRVKGALDNEGTYKYPAVNVNTFDGTVSLSGFVNLPEQKERATEIARTVPGVRQVIDSIVVKTEPTGRAPVIERPARVDLNNPGRDTNAAPNQLNDTNKNLNR